MRHPLPGHPARRCRVLQDRRGSLCGHGLQQQRAGRADALPRLLQVRRSGLDTGAVDAVGHACARRRRGFRHQRQGLRGPGQHGHPVPQRLLVLRPSDADVEPRGRLPAPRRHRRLSVIRAPALRGGLCDRQRGLRGLGRRHRRPRTERLLQVRRHHMDAHSQHRRAAHGGLGLRLRRQGLCGVRPQRLVPLRVPALQPGHQRVGDPAPHRQPHRRVV